MARLLVFLVALLMAPLAGAQSSQKTVPPLCTVLTLGTTCVPARAGTRARVIDATSTTVLGAGGGSVEAIVAYDGSAWIPEQPGLFIGENGDTIRNTGDGTFRLTIDEAGPATITCFDDAGGCPITLTPGGIGAVVVGSVNAPTVTASTDDGDIVLDGTNSIIAIQSGADPAVCTMVGELYLDTDETDDTACTTTLDNSICVCTAAGTPGTWASTE